MRERDWDGPMEGDARVDMTDKRPVHTAMQILEKDLDALGNAVDALSARLDPVLGGGSGTSPGPGMDDGPIQAKSQMAERIDLFAHRVSNRTREINVLLDRLEV